MGMPAARIGDMHMCPMVTPGVPPIPHVGGPLTGPGAPTVMIGSMPAATLGDIAVCVGPPSSIIMGSLGVMLGGKPAARMLDPTAHGGMITLGFPTVMIGDMSPSALAPAAAAAMGGAAAAEVAPEVAAIIAPAVQAAISVVLAQMSGPAHAMAQQTVGMVQAAAAGTPLVHSSLNCSICAKKK